MSWGCLLNFFFKQSHVTHKADAINAYKLFNIKRRFGVDKKPDSKLLPCNVQSVAVKSFKITQQQAWLIALWGDKMDCGWWGLYSANGYGWKK